MKNKKLNKKRLVLTIITLLLVFFLIVLGIILKEFSPVTKEEKYYNFEIKSGDTGYQIIDRLESEKIIKNAFLLKAYSKITKKQNFKVGMYKISTDMSSIKILNILNSDKSINLDEVTLEFFPGNNVRDLIKKVTSITNITEEEFLNTLGDKTYLKSLIDKYWFLTDEILNKDIYYSLEGYLYPDTYSILKTYNSKQIIEMLLNNTNKKFSTIKSDLENSKYTIHEILTLSSIVTLESGGSNEASKIAGVFINRLNNGWNLGSDVTTYYAIKVDLTERDLNYSDLNKCDNKYNTSSYCTGISLPVGPICNPVVNIIKDTINYTQSEYYYFVSDKNNKIYYSKTNDEHINTVNKLKKEGLWYEY